MLHTTPHLGHGCSSAVALSRLARCDGDGGRVEVPNRKMSGGVRSFGDLGRAVAGAFTVQVFVSIAMAGCPLSLR